VVTVRCFFKIICVRICHRSLETYVVRAIFRLCRRKLLAEFGYFFPRHGGKITNLCALFYVCVGRNHPGLRINCGWHGCTRLANNRSSLHVYADV